MNRFSYWPYDEVSLQADFAQQQITIKTPWLEATTNCNMIEESKIRSLTRKVNAQELSEMDLELFNDFFKHFSHMPFGYILPTRKKETSLDPHLLRDQTLLTQGLREIFRKILGSPERWTCDISDGEIEEALSILPRSTWEWDSDAAISFASIHGQVNPESLFSVARRFHLLELMQSDKGNQTFLAIAALTGDDFRERVSQLVRQNHYVTEKCQDALRPALLLAKRARPLLEHFMEEERGHDQILKKALIKMGVEPESVAVKVQTKVLMHLLAYCAHRNFLAFCMAIDAFERSNYSTDDPMATLLKNGGYEESSKFVNLHMKINDNGDHENVACQFLSAMDLCDHDYALEAMRLMELLSLVMCTIAL